MGPIDHLRDLVVPLLESYRPGRAAGQTCGPPQGGEINLNSILIGSEDPQRLVEYYTRLFGEQFQLMSPMRP